MNQLKVVRVIPGKASESTAEKVNLTPGRKFLQVIVKEMPKPGHLSQKREVSRNFFEGFKGKRDDGKEFNIKADPLYIGICEACGIKDDTPWEEKSFSEAVGMLIEGDIVTEYVEEYPISGSLSESDKRLRYTALVLDGEDKFAVFRTQGHVIITDAEERAKIEAELSEIAKKNVRARNERMAKRGIPTPEERVGTGALTEEQQYKA